MSHRRIAALLLPCLLAACSGLSREDRVEAKLEQAGLKPKLARCLAPKLARDLSNDQLRALADAAKTDDGGGHGEKALRRRLAIIDDPQVADVVSRAALACAIMG
jgi:hypothetical protein